MRMDAILPIVLLIVFIPACTTLPPQPVVNKIIWLEQGWSTEDRQRFHHTTQGTMTLPMPYEWFAALEQPDINPFGYKGLLIENGYLSRLGFISGEITPYNQAGLPVGFSVDYNVTNPSISKTSFNAIGLTCAACHTGQMNVGGSSIRYDGGPAMTNLTELVSVLGISLIETYLIESRFKRFSQRILGITNTKENRKKLKSALRHTLKNLIRGLLAPTELKDKGLLADMSRDLKEANFGKFIKASKELISNKKNKSTTEGFTRLDALNRIGNAVFGSDADNYANSVITTAPVNYPHIWNTSWFLWVQYDASIMGPMIRNSGEAMGVAAYVNLDKNSADNFNSSVAVENLHWMETLLGGTKPPTKNKKFGGLSHPKWDEVLLGKIDREKHEKGAQLYQSLCKGCHLAPIGSEEFWSKNWTKPNAEGQSYLDLAIVDLKYLGTDPQEAKVLMERKVDTTGVGLNTKIYLESQQWFTDKRKVYFGANKGDCKTHAVVDGSAVPFAVALGATVQEVNNYWYKIHNTPPARQDEMNGYRKNCLRAPFAYKARPLNGIWATAPYLHNGSVPNIFDLLSPVSERPKKFYLGSLDYDTAKLGYAIAKSKGHFQLDTSVLGNSNKGHEFSDIKAVGVIGRKLSIDERYQLIEYLKDI